MVRHPSVLFLVAYLAGLCKFMITRFGYVYSMSNYRYLLGSLRSIIANGTQRTKLIRYDDHIDEIQYHFDIITI